MPTGICFFTFEEACPFSGLELEILWSGAARLGTVTVAANNLHCNGAVIEINRLSNWISSILFPRR